MTTKFAKSSIAAIAIIVLAASVNGAFSATNGPGASGRGGPSAGSGGPGVHASITHQAPMLVHAWVPQRRRDLPNNCALQKWKHWDGEAFYYRVRTVCRDR